MVLVVITMNHRMSDKALSLHLLGEEKVKSIQWKIVPSNFEKTALSQDEMEECIKLLNDLQFSEKIERKRKYGAALHLYILLENGEERVISIFEELLTVDGDITKTITNESEEMIMEFTDRLIRKYLDT